MKISKILAGVAASAVAVSAMAFGASADQITPANYFYGDLEANGNLRIEVANAYSGIDTTLINDYSDLTFDGGISVTFDISGLTSTEDYTAFLMFTDLNWGWGVWSPEEFPAGTATINGDGTYTVYIDNTASTAQYEDPDTADMVPATATGANVFCVDIIGLGAAEGLVGFEAGADVDHGNITVSNVVINTWNAEADAADDAEAPADVTTGDKTSPDTGVEGVAAVVGVAALAAGALIVSKKRK